MWEGCSSGVSPTSPITMGLGQQTCTCEWGQTGYWPLQKIGHRPDAPDAKASHQGHQYAPEI